MTRFVFALVLVWAVGVLPVEASPVAQVLPQPFSLQAVQTGTGALFLLMGSTAWPVVPDAIGDHALASIALGEPSNTVDVDPRLAPPPTTRVMQASDGSLYVTTLGSRWNTGYPLVPDPIGDADLAGMTLGPELEGTVPLSLPTDPLPQAQAATPAPAAPTAASGASGQTPAPAHDTAIGPPCTEFILAPPPVFLPGRPVSPLVGPNEPRAPCTVIQVGQTISTTIYDGTPNTDAGGKVEGIQPSFGQDDGPGDLYEVYLKYGHTYKLDVGTTNYFGVKDPGDQGPIQGRLGIVLHAYNAYLLDLANCLACTNHPDSIYRARPAVLVPSGQVVCRYFKPGTPAKVAGDTPDCLFKALADTAYSVEVFEPGFANRTAPWHQLPQYSLTVREVS